MPIYAMVYDLEKGYIHNWLVAGPEAVPVPDLERFAGPDLKLQIARHYRKPRPEGSRSPVENEPLREGSELVWAPYYCADDHLVDLSAFYHTCHYLSAWAYACLDSPAAQEATLVLTTNGPADVWLNGQHVHQQEHFAHQIPQRVAFTAGLQEGRNEVLVRFEAVAMRECPYAMALEVRAPGLKVALPVTAGSPQRRRDLERALQAAYLERDVYVHSDEIVVRWPASMEPVHLTIRLQTPSGRIYAETLRGGSPKEPVVLSRAYEVPEGSYQAFLFPRPHEYYVDKLRLQRAIPLQVVHCRYAEAPYGTFEERRQEALLDAAQREVNVFSEIAKMALGYWADVRVPTILETIEGINQRRDCSDFYLVGLLGMLMRYGSDPHFPEEVRQALEACILGFRYWMDEPGDDAMCFWSENHQILFHTCEVLAGQLYPERVFANTGQSGRWHREKGERMALSWLGNRARGGFREWDSNCYFEEDLLALSHLADLAESPQVYELAAVVMDKMFFTMAVNSFRGAFGSTHGRTYAPFIKGARLEATAGISRLMWGMGAYNSHVLGTVSLACAEGYELPPLIARIAADRPEAMWARERHAGEMEAWCDRATGPWEVNKVTYKTPDYMLASAQDYHPGEPGYQEHIWQATLGPDAVVFVTHPPCTSEEGSHRPGSWHGNVVLPRVAQWKDVLIAIHKLPPDDWLGFTHAYFPTHAFEWCELREGWAFARRGEGYLALTAARGLEMVAHGDSAYRELRSYGIENVWVCHMGRAAQDGSFREFQDRVLRLKPEFGPLSVTLPTLRGDTLAFGWEGPLVVNGCEEAITGFKHYDNPYCVADLPATAMEIRFGDEMLRLNLE